MKKTILFSLLMTFIPLFIKADPAKKVTLSYNDGKLKIVAYHPVRNVKKHYIDKITITVDSKEVKVIKPTEQSNLQDETIEIVVPEIKTGSTVEVKTHCNEFGNKSAKLKM
jgi:hypothetical protein